MMMMMMMTIMELSGRLDGQASDWRTGSDQEALPPQHIIDPQNLGPTGNLFNNIFQNILLSGD